ncbi:MAG: SDR family oxidoreductase [Chitinophagaceae bacterium]|nr:SDR family oxidoreductase [Chitinophagaceae bacterium]
MKIFISGASGLIGSNCQQHFTQMGWDVTGTYYSFATPDTHYFDTLNTDNEANFNVQQFKPDVIVHCGALTHVDYCEQHPDESYEKTVTSTKNLLAIAQQLGAKFVYISTDYVFDGKQGPYHEEDATNPLGIYAKHKLQAEQMVLNAGAQHLVLRVTNVYGNEIRNKNFVARIIEQCIAEQALTLKLPFDQYATPVNAMDVARAMYLLLRDGHQGIFHIAGTDFMNRVDLALRVLKYFPSASYHLESLSTETLQQPALRPLIGGLQKTKFSNLYPDFLFSNVDDYVAAAIT